MDLQLKNRVALVAGASRGIGKAISNGLAAEGCDLVLCARGADALNECAEDLREMGIRVEALPGDITDPGFANELIERAQDRFSRLDIYVGSAGGNRRAKFEETSDTDWAEIMELNFGSHARISRTCIPLMKAAGGGSIIFISSIFGREKGGPGLSIYNTTKSALISLSGIMAQELAQYNIRVNSVAPGSIRFPGGSWDKRCIADPEKMAEFVKDNLPMGRFGTADEVADVVTFLASPRAGWISGTCLTVDGVQSRSLI
jgi:3-oxoacyl-[acyl-carrier protein] reductase